MLWVHNALIQMLQLDATHAPFHCHFGLGCPPPLGPSARASAPGITLGSEFHHGTQKSLYGKRVFQLYL